jgi:vancomycin resistance protein YoaR
MPQDSPADTVRMHADGTVGRSRPNVPSAANPATPAAEPPSDTTDATTDVTTDGLADPSPDAPVDESAPSDTQVIRPLHEPAPVDQTQVIRPVDEPADQTQVIGTADAPEPGPADQTQVIRPVDEPSAPAAPVDEHVVDAGGSGDGPAGPPATDGAGDGRSWWRRRAVLVPAVAVLALGVAYGVDLLAAGDDVPRGTVVAGVDLGGLSPAAAGERLTSDLAPRITADHPLVAADVPGVLHPPSAGIGLDVAATVDAVDDQPLNPWTRLTSLFADRAVDPVLTQDRTALEAQVEQLATTVDRAPVDATITLDGTTPSLVEPAEGRTLDRDGTADAITAALTAGADPSSPIELPVDIAPVRVEAAEAQRVLDETVTPALSAPVTVVGTDGTDSVDVPETAIAASLTFTPAEDGTLAVAVDPAALQNAMGEGFATFGSPAQDARFEVSGDAIAVVPSVDGQGINPVDLAGQLLPVLDDPAPRSVTATLGPVPAAFTTEQAQALGITEQVSSFSTNFSNSASGTNIRVVAAEVDGAVVKPGETFSLNDYTGPRGTAQGYVPAAVISGGELSQAVGGGISQFATTMFNAVFFAGLEDVYHKPHSFYISRYPAGREATVYEGVIDLQWRNDSDTGIYVQAEWVPGTITVTFWGTKHYEIESVSGERRNLREPAVQDKVDDGNCTPQGGSTGFDITVTRVFKDLGTGAELRRENFDTRYAAEAIIHCIPAAPEAPPAVPPAVGGATPPAAPTGRRPGERAPQHVRTRVRRPRS